MASKGVQDRVFACAPTIWAAFAYSEFVAEAIRRRWPKLEARLHQRQAERGDGDPGAVTGRHISLPQLMRGIGTLLGRARDRMAAADRGRERQRAALEEDRRRRDELVKTIYGRVVWTRDLFEERVGRRRTTSYLAVKGETPRDPKELDELRCKAGRYLESLLEVVELPTLAAACGRNTGRRGGRRSGRRGTSSPTWSPPPSPSTPTPD